MMLCSVFLSFAICASTLVSSSRPATAARQNIRGLCYDAWPLGYIPSRSKFYAWSYWSDIAGNHTQALWGNGYKQHNGRYDLADIASKNFTHLKLYGYWQKFNHAPFFSAADEQGLKVMVPLPEDYLQDALYQDLTDDYFTELILSFAESNGSTKYHPAIDFVVFGNECDLDVVVGKITGTTAADRALSVVDRYIKQERILGFSSTSVLIGIPISSGVVDQSLAPGVQFHMDFVEALKKYPDTSEEILQRYVICINVYSSAVKGWIPEVQAFLKKKTGVDVGAVITEIGHSRNDVEGPKDMVDALRWAFSGENGMMGAVFFQYADKAWDHGSGSEGGFGLYSQEDEAVAHVLYEESDFPLAALDYWRALEKLNGTKIEIVSNVSVNWLNVTENWLYIERLMKMIEDTDGDDDENHGLVFWITGVVIVLLLAIAVCTCVLVKQRRSEDLNTLNESLVVSAEEL